MARLKRYIGDDYPTKLWWEDSGTLVDFSAANTYILKVFKKSSSTAIFTKTTGFAGAAGSGTEDSGTPNLTITWATTGELNSIPSAGLYEVQIVATKTADSTERTGVFELEMLTRR